MGSARSSRLSTRENTAVFAAMPRASETTATPVITGVAHRARMASRKSCSIITLHYNRELSCRAAIVSKTTHTVESLGPRASNIIADVLENVAPHRLTKCSECRESLCRRLGCRNQIPLGRQQVGSTLCGCSFPIACRTQLNAVPKTERGHADRCDRCATTDGTPAGQEAIYAPPPAHRLRRLQSGRQASCRRHRAVRFG